MLKRYFFIVPVIILFSGCYYDNASELNPAAGLNSNCDTVNVTYNEKIAPIFQSYCGTNNSCHSASVAEGGVILSDYTHAFTTDPISLIESIEQTGNSPMPPSGKLSECNINLIKIWIQNGKPE